MKKKIIIDTNIWISYLISNKFQDFDNFILSEKYQIFFSTQLLEELLIVINKPNLVKYINKEDVSNILNFIETNTMFVEINKSFDLCRDDKDNFLLSMCFESDADYLLTGDKDLLVLNYFKSTQILNYSDFITNHF